MEKHGEYNPQKSYIKILRNDDIDTHIPVVQSGDDQCDFCGRCVEWCPEKILKIMAPEEAVIARRKSKVGTIPLPMVASIEA
jgi:ferredoxin